MPRSASSAPRLSTRCRLPRARARPPGCRCRRPGVRHAPPPAGPGGAIAWKLRAGSVVRHDIQRQGHPVFPRRDLVGVVAAWSSEMAAPPRAVPLDVASRTHGRARARRRSACASRAPQRSRRFSRRASPPRSEIQAARPRATRRLTSLQRGAPAAAFRRRRAKRVREAMLERRPQLQQARRRRSPVARRDSMT